MRFTQRARAGARRPHSWPSIPQDSRAGSGESRRQGGTQGLSLHLGPGLPRHLRPAPPPTLLGHGVEGRCSDSQLWMFTLARRLGRRKVHLGQAARSGAGARKTRPDPTRRRLRLTRPSRVRRARASARRPPTRRARRAPPPLPRSRTYPRPARTEAAGADAAPPAASWRSQTTFPTRPRGRGVDVGVRRRRPTTGRRGSSRGSEVAPSTALLGWVAACQSRCGRRGYLTPAVLKKPLLRSCQCPVGRGNGAGSLGKVSLSSSEVKGTQKNPLQSCHSSIRRGGNILDTQQALHEWWLRYPPALARRQVLLYGLQNYHCIV